MIKRAAALALFAIVCALPAAAQDLAGVDIPYERHVLDNGLTVLIHVDRSAPQAFVNVYYKVGSRDEKTGKTGFAHLFEHLMFNGSENYDEEYFVPIQDVGGSVNGDTFSGLKDTDTFLSLFLEAIVHERYVWIPFEAIRELSISPPRTLFDLLWVTARITTWEGLTLNCFLPVLYPESFLHEDDRIKLGRMTDWTPLGGPFSKGMGQHVFQVGEEEIPLLEIQDAVFQVPQETSIE